MDQPHHYQPCFSSVPSSATQRWTLLRTFVQRWYDLEMPLDRDLESAAHETQAELGLPLSDSIREWIAFAKDLKALGRFEYVLRDCFEVARFKRLGCTTLLLQGEGDVYWAVRDEHADQDDPPVDCLHRDLETGRWTIGWRDTDSLTSFVLWHMAAFLGPGFTRVRDITDEVIAVLTDAFPVSSEYNGILILEDTDLIGFVRSRTEGEPTLTIARQPSLPESALPECVRRLCP